MAKGFAAVKMFNSKIHSLGTKRSCRYDQEIHPSLQGNIFSVTDNGGNDMENKKSLPLAGINVIELATVVAAPAVGRVLATYGANVIKIEAPPDGDLIRGMSKGHQLPSEPYNSPLFDVLNSGKKTISINLKSEKGKEALHKLLEQSDIFITNVRMKSLIRMGLGYDALKDKYPSLIYGHFSGFGLEGPDADRPGFDTTAFWLRSGAIMDWVVPGSFVIRPSFGFGDLATSSSFLSGILMALYARTVTNRGTLVSTSLLSSGIWCNATSVVNAQPQYGKNYPQDRYHPWDPFSDFYECKDGEWVAVMEKSYATDKAIFAELFDMPELMTDPRLADLVTMRETDAVAEVVAKVEKIMLTRTAEEWCEIFDANDIPNEKVRHFKEVYLDQQAWVNGCFEKVSYPDGAETALPMPPILFSDFGRKGYETKGCVGEDTEEILRSLGYSDKEIADMRSKKEIL